MHFEYHYLKKYESSDNKINNKRFHYINSLYQNEIFKKVIFLINFFYVNIKYLFKKISLFKL